MQLLPYVGEEGYEIESIETKSNSNLVDFKIIGSHLNVVAKISDEIFQELVTKAEKYCPMSKVFNTKITSAAALLYFN
jgi:osmotically inducible protein OsmC